MARKKKSSKQPKQPDKKQCANCKKEKAVTYGFYTTDSPMFPDGYLPFCKDCLVEMVDENDLDSLHRILRQIDKPFIKRLWEAAKESNFNTVKKYMTMINSMKDFKHLKYDDSDHVDVQEKKSLERNYDEVDNQYEKIIDEFEVTPELIRRWGRQENKEAYMRLEGFYNDLTEQFDIKAPQDREQAKRLAKLNLAIDRAFENGDSKEIRDLTDTYNKILASSGLSAKDRKESDNTKSFGEICAEVEKHGFIKPAPIEEHQDIVDRTIWYMRNFILDLFNLEKSDKPPADTPIAKQGGDNDDESGES